MFTTAESTILFFWGVEFSDADGSHHVRCLYWHSGQWQAGYILAGR